MATVNVSNFSEFVAAVAVSGNTVNLPQNGEWNLNDSYPEGYTTDIPINCAIINGNGTEIKNLHFYGKFVVPSDLTINDLSMTNIICEDTTFFDNDGNERKITLNRSIFTGLFGVNAHYFNSSKMHMNRSVLNLNMTSASGTIFFCWDTFTAIYSRITLNFPSTAGSLWLNSVENGIKYSMFKAVCPGLQSFDSRYFSGCVILGNYGEAYDTNDYGQHGNFVSVYDSAAFSDEFTTENPYFKPVTYAQLYDAAYLASIGFPIGV